MDVLLDLPGPGDQVVLLVQHPAQPDEVLLTVRDRQLDTAALSLTRAGVEAIRDALTAWIDSR